MIKAENIKNYMKKNDRLRKEAEVTMSKIRAITRHIRNVEDNCFLLGEKLILNGEIDLGKQLIANGFVHDASKFHGIEFEFMTPGAQVIEESAKVKLKLAIHQHNTTNKHHPESWSGGIQDMPDVFLAEFCCDIKARSEEFGTSLREWIDETATKKWNFSTDEDVYKKIMKYVNLLCDIPFEQIK
jgi:Family of unknown function (DUF5662)